MIKAIIFDCFGVLAEDGWLPFKRKHIGGNVELAQAVADLGKQNEYGMLSSAEFTAQAAELMGVPPAELVAALGKQVPNQELFEFINTELKPKYKIGLLTNANYDVLRQLFTPEQAGVFDATAMSFETRLIKPDKRMFQVIADRLGVLPEECVFIDDVERYCIAAEQYGMVSILYESPGQLKAGLSRIFQLG